MNKDEYQKLVKEYTPKENKIKHAWISFLIGGCVGFFAEFLVMIYQTCFGFDLDVAMGVTCLSVILFASLATSLGFFDEWVSFARAGLFLPTTGFAHSLTSAALDYKKDGFITGLGSNVFKLAGSVLLYGIISGFFFALLGVMIHG